jgi:hypothetical protein
LHEAAEAIPKTNYLHAMGAFACFADASNGGVEAGAVSPGG